MKIVGAEQHAAQGTALCWFRIMFRSSMHLWSAALCRGSCASCCTANTTTSKGLNWFFRLMHSIPVSATNRRDIVQSLKHARNELDKGQVVCIFAEGAISRTGRLLPFKRGFEKIVDGTNIPIIPVHLDQLWGSIFSFKDGRFFWKWPKQLSYPVTVSFGPPLPSDSTAFEVRNAVVELESNAFEHRPQRRGFAAHQGLFKWPKGAGFLFVWPIPPAPSLPMVKP